MGAAGFGRAFAWRGAASPRLPARLPEDSSGPSFRLRPLTGEPSHTPRHVVSATFVPGGAPAQSATQDCHRLVTINRIRGNIILKLMNRAIFPLDSRFGRSGPQALEVGQNFLIYFIDLWDKRKEARQLSGRDLSKLRSPAIFTHPKRINLSHFAASMIPSTPQHLAAAAAKAPAVRIGNIARPFTNH